MDTDRNLLFGVLALQADLIDSGQFVEACTLWCTRKDVPLADVLAGRGWITPDDRVHVEYLLERKLQKHGGDARAGLANVADDIKRSLAAVGDADIQESLVALPGPVQTTPAATVDHVPTNGPRYSLTRLHATGGIGRVWLARDAQLGRDVALKELRPERAASAALWGRFLKEARITGQLEHPGIVPVYELARRPDDQQPFYTMRFVKGRTLTEAASAFHEKRLAGRHEPLDLLTLLNAFVAVCNAVAYAHSRGVIHRDLKGQNVILGDFGEVVVLDWGLAKLVECPGDMETMPAVVDAAAPEQSDHTVQGQMIGTPAYMAPEQAEGRLDLIDRRTDVYGLGAVLYEILTGRPPFTGSETHEVLRKVREEEPGPPRQLWPDAPPALEAVCLRALTKDPAGRYDSASALAQEVQGWQEFERRKAEDALRESEALYHSLVETIPLSVWRKDLGGRFIFANKRFCDSLGKPLEQVISRTDYHFFPPELAAKYRADDARVHETGTIIETTEDHQTAAGEKLYVRVVKAPVFDAHGRVIGTQGIFWDLTQWKRTEEELRRSRERFELAVQGSQDGLWDWDLTTDEVYYSPRYKAMLGYSEREFPNRREEWAKRVHPDDIERVRSELRAHFKGRESLSLGEYRMRHKDGSHRWIRNRAFVLRDPTSGRVYRMAGSHEDITERKHAEEELRKSRERFELAVLASQDGMWDWDIQANTVWYSPQWKQMLGYEDHEIPNRPGEWRNLLHPDDYDRAVASLYGHIDGPDTHWVSEQRLRHKDGSYRWVRTYGVALRDSNGKAYRAAGSQEDITERRNAEEQLAQERYLFHTLMDNQPDAIYFVDTANRFIRANKFLANLVGLNDPAQLVGKTYFDILTEQAARKYTEENQEIIRSGVPSVAKENLLAWADGRMTWASATKTPFRDRDGRIIGVFGITRDITERKQAEEALRESEARYRSVIAAMQDGILILDAEAGILDCNAAAERILGLSAEQLMGRTPQDPRWRAVHEDGSPFPGDTFPSMVTLRTGKPCFDVIMGVHKSDGELTWISINSQPLFRPGEDRPHAVVASFEDITGRKRTEDALRETAAELARCRQELDRLRGEGSEQQREALR